MQSFRSSFSSVLLFLCVLLFASGACGQACVGDYIPDGDEIPCGDPEIPCCSEPFACNGPNSPCNNYDPDFQDTGGCDLSCTAGCMDEEAQNYDPNADFDGGYCFYDKSDECDAIYNPDSNCDSLINFEDFLVFLGLFGEDFIPPLPTSSVDSTMGWNDVFIDSLSLLEWAQGIEEQVNACCQASSSYDHEDIEILPATYYEFIVPNGVYSVEISMSAGTGAQGQGTTNCPYGSGFAGGCGGGLGGYVRALVNCSPGDSLIIQTGYTPESPAPFNSCGIGANGDNGADSYLAINGYTVLEVTGGQGGLGVHCSCGNALYSCSNLGWVPSNGSVLGPYPNSGVFILETSFGGEGNCGIRY